MCGVAYGAVMRDVEEFLEAIAAWAARTEVRAVGLAGSWARGVARPDSDVDLVLLVDRVADWFGAVSWPDFCGPAERHVDEDWGLVRSRRVHYPDGLEVEYGVTTPEWAALPLDAGTERVIRDGLRVLYDPEDLLTPAVRAALGDL